MKKVIKLVRDNPNCWVYENSGFKVVFSSKKKMTAAQIVYVLEACKLEIITDRV